VRRLAFLAALGLAAVPCSPADADVVPGRFIVGFSSRAATARAGAIVVPAGGHLRRTLTRIRAARRPAAHSRARR
jgi:hypothetical protein